MVSESEPFVIYDLHTHEFERWRSECRGDREHSGDCSCNLLLLRQRQLLYLASQIVTIVFENDWDTTLNLPPTGRLAIRQYLTLSKKSERRQSELLSLLSLLRPSSLQLLRQNPASRPDLGTFSDIQTQALLIMAALSAIISKLTRGTDNHNVCITLPVEATPSETLYGRRVPKLTHTESETSGTTAPSVTQMEQSSPTWSEYFHFGGNSSPNPPSTKTLPPISPSNEREIMSGSDSRLSSLSHWSSLHSLLLSPKRFDDESTPPMSSPLYLQFDQFDHRTWDEWSEHTN